MTIRHKTIRNDWSYNITYTINSNYSPKLKSYGIRVWAPHGEEEADDEEWALVSEDGENCSQGKLQVIMHTQERSSDDHTFIGISYSLVDPSVNVVRHGTKQRVPAKLWWLFVPKKKLLHHHPLSRRNAKQKKCIANEKCLEQYCQ